MTRSNSQRRGDTDRLGSSIDWRAVDEAVDRKPVDRSPRVRGIGFRSLTEASTRRTAQWRWFSPCLARWPEFERSLLRERQSGAGPAARRAGPGRPDSRNHDRRHRGRKAMSPIRHRCCCKLKSRNGSASLRDALSCTSTPREPWNDARALGRECAITHKDRTLQEGFQFAVGPASETLNASGHSRGLRSCRFNPKPDLGLPKQERLVHNAR